MAMHHGQKAVELIRDLARSTDVIPPYNHRFTQNTHSSHNTGTLAYIEVQEDATRQIIEEINALHREIRTVLSNYDKEERETPYIAMNLNVHNASMKKNKRCLLAYVMHRMRRIKDLRWELGTSVLPDEIKENLNALEVQFFSEYDKILGEYMRGVGNIDLTGDLIQPPKELFIEVRVKQEVGAFVTSSGNTINLKANTTHYLRRSDVETLIRQGVLEHL